MSSMLDDVPVLLSKGLRGCIDALQRIMADEGLEGGPVMMSTDVLLATSLLEAADLLMPGSVWLGHWSAVERIAALIVERSLEEALGEVRHE